MNRIYKLFVIVIVLLFYHIFVVFAVIGNSNTWATSPSPVGGTTGGIPPPPPSPLQLLQSQIDMVQQHPSGVTDQMKSFQASDLKHVKEKE